MKNDNVRGQELSPVLGSQTVLEQARCRAPDHGGGDDAFGLVGAGEH